MPYHLLLICRTLLSASSVPGTWQPCKITTLPVTPFSLWRSWGSVIILIILYLPPRVLLPFPRSPGGWPLFSNTKLPCSWFLLTLGPTNRKLQSERKEKSRLFLFCCLRPHHCPEGWLCTSPPLCPAPTTTALTRRPSLRNWGCDLENTISTPILEAPGELTLFMVARLTISLPFS